MAYSERLNAQGVLSGRAVVEHFGVSDSAGKAIWVASEEFNARFSYENWKSRRDRSGDGYGALNWLKRKYKLDDATTDVVTERFESGDERSLLTALDFKELARRLLNPQAENELEELGLLESTSS